jgi:hypothetical protein
MALQQADLTDSGWPIKTGFVPPIPLNAIKSEVDVTQAQLSRNNIEVLFGTASFTGPNQIKVIDLSMIKSGEMVAQDRHYRFETGN